MEKMNIKLPRRILKILGIILIGLSIFLFLFSVIPLSIVS